MRLISLFSLFAAALISSNLNAEVLFQDDFEGGVLKSDWAITKTNDGKVSIRNDYGPASGQGHLVFEDAVSDAIYSSSEATLSVNLKNKKDAVLSFKVKSLGDEPHEPWYYSWNEFRNYDGIAVSGDGGITWNLIHSLTMVEKTWSTVEVPLDEVLYFAGTDHDGNFQIRFSQYDNASAPVDGLAIDDVSVRAEPDRRVVLEVQQRVTEGQGPLTALAFLSIPSDEPVRVILGQGTPGQFLLPAEIVFQPGETSTAFQFSVADDDEVNFSRSASIMATGEGITPGAAYMEITDNEAKPVVTLTLPSQVIEGNYLQNNAVISISAPTTQDLGFYLSASPDSQLTWSYSVTIPAGQTQAVFSVNAGNDDLLDGNIAVTFKAENSFLGVVTAQVMTIDNEIPNLILEIPATIREGTTVTATARVSAPLASLLTVNLSAPYDNRGLSFPSWVVIPPGQTSVTFQISSANDSLINLSRTVSIRATGAGVNHVWSDVVITDDEPLPSLALSVPTELREGDLGNQNGNVTLSGPIDVNLYVGLSPSPSGEVNVLSNGVHIPAGQTSASFSIRAVDDYKIDGNVPVVVKAKADGLPEAAAATMAIDNENREISVNLWMNFEEGQSGTSTVQISGSLAAPLEITLRSSDPAILNLPPNVIIPAGDTSAFFSYHVPGNDTRDGTRSISLTATASGFITRTMEGTVADDDPAFYAFGELDDLLDVDRPNQVWVYTKDLEGNRLSYSGRVNLWMVLPDETTVLLTPEPVELDGINGWSGDVTLPPVAGREFRLRATDAEGISGDSESFGLMRSLNLQANDLVWDSSRSRFYASIASGSGSDPNAVVAFDPETMQITGRVTLNSPGRLALTSGNEFLYVVNNGNGTISQIDPAGMAVISTFSIGPDTYSPGNSLIASDLCTVAGQPNLLLVSTSRQSGTPVHMGVAVYDNGVMRAVKTAEGAGGYFIEPSADPSVYFGYNSITPGNGFYRLKIGSTGVTEMDATTGMFSGGTTDIRSDGDRVFSTNGVIVDGNALQRVGSLSADGLVLPELAKGRVYFAGYHDYTIGIAAYDPLSLNLIQFVSAPELAVGSFIRWGSNGLAFRTSDSIRFFKNEQIVPSEPPADLEVSVELAQNIGSVPQALTYTVTMANQGPYPAAQAVLHAELSRGQTVQNISSSHATPEIDDSRIRLPLGNLAPGEIVTLTITAMPDGPGGFSCGANVVSVAVDSDLRNNFDAKFTSIGYEQTCDVLNRFRLAPSHLVSDSTRNRLWAALPGRQFPGFGASVVSIDPTNGEISQPIPIHGAWEFFCMAISANGRYLYVGLYGEVQRLDLSTSPPAVTHIPLGLNSENYLVSPRSIDVLDGDGTSFIVGGTNSMAAVYDGNVRRPNRAPISYYTQIARLASPGIYIAKGDYGTLTLKVTASGISVNSQAYGGILNTGGDFATSGNLVLTYWGDLYDAGTMTRKARLNDHGVPCLDERMGRAYLASPSTLTCYDTSGNVVGTTPLVNGWGDASACIRWGADGLAVAGGDGKVSVIRWSLAIPEELDSNADHVPDSWAARHFATLKFDPAGDSDQDGIPNALEYMFGTSPSIRSGNPVKLASDVLDESSKMKLSFQRRKGVKRPDYVYETSADLKVWVEVPAAETILSVETIDGATLENMDARIVSPDLNRGFVRLRWK